MKRSKIKCQVCFFNQFTNLQNAQVIFCKGCKREAHRYCYQPQCEDKYFQCDACQNKIKNPQCCICHNDGLMKKTQQGQFAHPACLMLSKQSLVKSYQKLSFYLLRKKKKKAKQGKCDICGKTSLMIDLLKCFDGHCSSVAHFYCILKEQWKDNEQGNKWVQNLKMFESNYLNCLQHFQNKVKFYINQFPNAIYKSIFDQKKIVDISPAYITYCRNHSQNLTNCYCETLDDGNTKIDWVFCDSCGKWYHFHCEQIDVNQVIQEEYYTCRCCKQWKRKIQSKQEPILPNFPKLHFYDLVYIQNFAENRGYRVSTAMIELIKRVPFLCSIRYFNQILKDKDIISKIIKKTNFLPIKTAILDKANSKKQLTKTIQKPTKGLTDALWKMDFLTCIDPLQVINRAKKPDYKLQQMISIMQRYDKRYTSGLNLVKPAIKQLIKYRKNNRQNQQSESEQSADQQSINQIQASISILRQQLKQLKKASSDNKNTPHILTNFYKKITDNQVLKQILKNYVQQNRAYSQILQPIFIYQSELEMYHHTKFNFVYQRLNYSYQGGQKLKNIEKLYMYCDQVYRKCPKKVQLQNSKVMRELMLLGKSQYTQYDQKYTIIQNISNNKNTKNAKKVQQNICNIFSVKNIKYSSNHMLQVQKYIQNEYKIQLIDYIFRNLELKSSSLNYLYLQYPKIKDIMKNKEQTYYKPYIKMYEATKVLVQLVCEGVNVQNQVTDMDMLAYIKKLKIDRQNINQFCDFFVQVCQLNLSNLKPDFNKTIQQKGLEFLTIICGRSMIIQCQIQFKAAFSLMSKYNYKRLQKIQQVIDRNKQLVDMLKNFSLDSLQDLAFVESNIKLLKEARQYCQENNLQFRISKIQYILKLFQIKEEAFKYFPAEFVVRNRQKLPKKYLNMDKKYTIDYCLLKKFIYKLKLIKFPMSDHLNIKANQLYNSRTDYFNVLSSIIAYYNCLTFNQPIIVEYPKFKKSQIEMLISTSANSFVTCQPQQQQISIIFSLYDQVLEKIDNIVKNDINDIEYCTKVFKQFLKFPFEMQENSICTVFFDKINKLKNNKQIKQIKLEVQCINVQNNNVNKKIYQQQTSQKGDLSEKDKNVNNFISQIYNKPRLFTVQDIKKKLSKIKDKNTQSSINIHLNKIFQTANRINQVNSYLINKFSKGQPYTQSESNRISKMIQEYQSQPINIQIIQSFIKYIKKKQKSILISNYEQSRKNNQPYASRASNRSLSSQVSKKGERSQSKNSNKVKKTKVVLRK